MMLCEHCDSACHTYCCDPPLKEVPVGPFFCSECDPVWAENANVNHVTGERLQAHTALKFYRALTRYALYIYLTLFRLQKIR